jgi:hypothetical protein
MVQRKGRLIEAVAPGRNHLLFLWQGVTLLGQSIELFALLNYAIGISLLGLATGAPRRLFHQLPQIVLKNGDTIVELRS